MDSEGGLLWFVETIINVIQSFIKVRRTLHRMNQALLHGFLKRGLGMILIIVAKYV